MKTVNLSKIIELINSRSYEKAEIELKDQVENQPNNFLINKMYGVTLLAQKKYLMSIKSFENCYNLKNDDYDVNVNLSYLFAKTQDYKKSLIYSQEAIKLNDDRPEAYQNISECLLNLKNFNEAEKNISIAIDKRGGLESEEILKYHDTLSLYGDIILAKKEEKKFCEFAFKILDKGNHIAQILISLIRIDVNNMKEIYLNKMNNILKDINSIKSLPLKATTESNIYFILAEYFQKKDTEKSEEYYLKANKIIASLQRGSLFERQKKVAAVIDYFKKIKKTEMKDTNSINKGKGLIFIMGMPRSGTTLVESIIASANNCVAGGEKLFFPLEFDQLLSENKISKIDSSYIQKLGDKYLETIEIHRDGKKFFTDKLPENYLYCGLIKLALPGAKFIHISRNIWDNAVSLFKQNYSFNLSYTSSFFGIALEYANYEYVVNFWRKNTDHETFIDISYEEMTSDINLIAKKIWDYCGLEGTYDENKRVNFFSLTASKQQVTKEIYHTSKQKSDFGDYKSKFFNDLSQQREYWSGM